MFFYSYKILLKKFVKKSKKITKIRPGGKKCDFFHFLIFHAISAGKSPKFVLDFRPNWGVRRAFSRTFRSQPYGKNKHRSQITLYLVSLNFATILKLFLDPPDLRGPGQNSGGNFTQKNEKIS